MSDIKRVRYFDHEFLEAADFEVEQEYHRGMRYRHTRDFHTWGVASKGLEVNVAENQETGEETKIVIYPGTALDNEGREIVLTESRFLDFDQPRFNGGKSYYITIRWHEQQGMPRQDDQHKRWVEVPQIQAVEHMPERPDLELVLAKVTIRKEIKTIETIDNSLRRYAAHEVGDKTVKSVKIVEADGVSGQDINRGDGIKTGHIQDGAVTTGKLADLAVIDGKLAKDAVTTLKIVNGSVTGPKLGADSVTSSKIKDGNVGTAELANGAVSEPKLGVNSVTSSRIKDGNVGTAKLANGAVTEPKLGVNSVTSSRIRDGNVGTAELANGAVTESKLGTNSVTSSKIRDGNVGTAELANGAVSRDKLGANSVTNQKIVDGSVSEAKLSADIKKKLVANGDNHTHSLAALGGFPVTGGTVNGPVTVNGKLTSQNARAFVTVYDEVIKEKKCSTDPISSEIVWEDIPGMSIDITTGNNSLLIFFDVYEISFSVGYLLGYFIIRLVIDNEQIFYGKDSMGGKRPDLTFKWLGCVSAGKHTIKGQYYLSPLQCPIVQGVQIISLPNILKFSKRSLKVIEL